MRPEDFVHLHLHTEYSLLDGACRIDRVFQRAKEMGQTAVAITDHGVMYGVIRFYKEALRTGVRPILGCEVYLAAREHTDKEAGLDRESSHLVLLCENMQGYRNLMKLVTVSFTEGFYQKPRVDLALLKKHHEGLIALSACLAGRIPRLILAGDMDGAEKHALEMAEIFGKDSFFLEMQDHGIPDQLRVNAGIRRIAEKTGLGTVITNDVHYLSKEDAKSHDALLCIQTGKTVQDENRMKFETEEFYLKSAEEMKSLFPRDEEALLNTSRIAQRCQLDFDFSEAHLPTYTNPLGLSSPEYLRKICAEGLKLRLKENGITDTARYEERLAYELDVVEKMGFCDYFLIVSDFVRFAKKNDIAVGPGRGSGAGSLAAWCLDITELDPIKNGLIFERFLNPERISMPDFDIDFCNERRYEVIEYLKEKYGREHVFQIGAFSTMAARAAVRDVGRVLGMPFADVDRIKKRIPQFQDMNLEKALEEDGELRSLCQSGDGAELMRVAKTLEGMPRNMTIHAAGVLLTDKDASEYVPLTMNAGAKITQYTMDELASLGLLKIDLLGVRYLTIMQKAEKEVRKKHPEFDIHAIPTNDKETFEMISRGETAGLFQIESSGMKAVMMQLRPESIDDITAAIALYRPGPKSSIPRFLKNRKMGNIQHPIPALTRILESTHGCIVYQEQVMEIFRELAGYSFGRADVVRKAMSKKHKDEMEKERSVFLYGSDGSDGKAPIEGAIARGIPKNEAEKVFAEMESFAEYAFNKSHAAAYALFSYRTAYLKCKFPAEYMAAVMTAQMGNEKYSYYFSECQRMGIDVLPPHINESEHSFTVCGNGLRVGLVGVKNVGDALIENIFRERSRSPFRSFGDFVDRMRGSGLNKKALESLVFSGAMDCFGIARSRLISAVAPMMDNARDSMRSMMSGQMSLFEGGEMSDGGSLEDYPDIPEYDEKELLRGEKSVCGVYFSGHPLKNYAEIKEKLGAEDILSFRTEPERYTDGQEVTLLCLVETVTQKQARNGARMAFIQGEDQTGRCEIVVFPKVLEKSESLLFEGSVVALTGKINTKDEEIKILAENFSAPESADFSSKAPKKVEIRKNEGEKSLNFQSVSKLFLRFPEKGSKIERRVMALLRIFPGSTPCYFYYLDSQKLFHLAGLTCDLTPRIYQELVLLLGEENVKAK